MTLYAHRGWSTGKGSDWIENTLSAFDKSKSNGLRAVELDVRRHPRTGQVVLSHDKVEEGREYTTLSDALGYISEAGWDVIIEFKEYDKSFFDEVQTLLAKYELLDKAVLFGFYNVVKDFLWHKVRQTRLGVIIEYPWHMERIISDCKPDVVLLGFNECKWVKLAFKLWWSIASLSKASERYNVSLISGVAQSKADIKWLEKQGIEGYTADMQRAVA